MRKIAALCASAAISAASLALGAAPAQAGETESAVLACGSAGDFTVTGFGRGQVLFVTGTTQRFIVTFAQLEDGRVVFEAPGQRKNENVVTCTTSSPISGRTFTFQGFFTPAA